MSSKATFYQLSEAAYLQENPQEAAWYRQQLADRERLNVERRARSAKIRVFRAKIRSHNRDRKRQREREEKLIKDELSRECPPSDTSLESGRLLETFQPEGTSVTTTDATPIPPDPAADVAVEARRMAVEDREREFEEVIAAMSRAAWDWRVIAALKECKADPVYDPQWRHGTNSTKQQRYAIGVKRARDTLRAELERNANPRG